VHLDIIKFLFINDVMH